MNRQYRDHKQDAEFLPLIAKSEAMVKTQEPQVNPAVLISKLFYALLIIGFMGYYVDRIMQSVKG